MRYCEKDYNWLPDKIIVGKYDGSVDHREYGRKELCGFVTCRYKNEKWAAANKFEELCGYKPNTQKDSKKELMKAIENKVDEFENVPVSGFELVSWQENIYCRGNSRRAYEYGFIVLRDPRGFCIEVDENDFMCMLLNDCDGNLENGKLPKAYSYVFSSTGFLLVAEDSKHYQEAKSYTELHVQRQKAITAHRKTHKLELKVGHFYDDKKGDRRWLYLGKMDWFSQKAWKDFRNSRFCSRYSSKWLYEELLDLQRGFGYHRTDDTKWPWKDSEWLNLVVTADSSFTSRHVFVDLGKTRVEPYYDITTLKTFYLKMLFEPRISEESNPYLDFTRVRFRDGNGTSDLAGESENQSMTYTLELHTWSGSCCNSTYKDITISLEDIVEMVSKNIKSLKAEFDDIVTKKYPIEDPTNPAYDERDYLRDLYENYTSKDKHNW